MKYTSFTRLSKCSLSFLHDWEVPDRASLKENSILSKISIMMVIDYTELPTREDDSNSAG